MERGGVVLQRHGIRGWTCTQTPGTDAGRTVPASVRGSVHTDLLAGA